MHFRATIIGFSEDFGVLVIGFGDDSEPDRRYVMLQGLIDPADPQWRPEDARVHMEIDDQSRSGFDFTRDYSICGRQVRLRIDPKAHEKLRVSDDVTIDIADPNADLGKLSRALAVIYGNAGYK